jgi:hypothetical protein
VSIQRFIKGREATSTIASWRGRILANLSFEVLRTSELRGPAAVLRLIDNSDMSEAAELLARGLNLSGIFGLDFVLEEAAGHPYLIEMNARATQTSHLALGPGRDLAEAIYSALSGRPVANRRKVTDGDVIALFPLEWKNDPASPFLTWGYHDVPWGEPELVEAGILERPGLAKWISALGRTENREAAGQAAPPQQWVRDDDTVSAKAKSAGSAI